MVCCETSDEKESVLSKNKQGQRNGTGSCSVDWSASRSVTLLHFVYTGAPLQAFSAHQRRRGKIKQGTQISIIRRISDLKIPSKIFHFATIQTSHSKLAILPRPRLT